MKGKLIFEKTTRGKIVHKVRFTGRKGNEQCFVVNEKEQLYGPDIQEGAEVEFELESGAVVKNCRLPGQQIRTGRQKPAPGQNQQAWNSVVTGTAPYNFVPCVPGLLAQPPEGKRQWSGKIVCRLTALTPLLVASGETAGEKGGRAENSPRKFLSLNGRPVIPGTSLKGMLRSLMEILSFSGLRPMDRHKFFWRNVTGKPGKSSNSASAYKVGMPDPPKGGYIVQRGADFYILQVPVSTAPPPDGKNWAKVLVNRLPTARKPATNSAQATDGDKKIYYFRKPANGDTVQPLDREVWQRFERQMTDKQAADYFNQLKERLKNGRGMPVFYREEKGPDGSPKVAELGFCRYFRREYAYSAFDLAWPDREMEKRVDMAEAIFGHARDMKTGDGSLKPLAGRIAVSACFLEGREMPTPLKAVLSSPKPTCVPFYLEQNPANIKTISGGRKNDLETMKNYNDRSARLRGHKLYWHHDMDKQYFPQGNRNEKTLSTLCPLEAGATGTFVIHAQRLADWELGCLLEALELLPGHHHKLGAGKPLGLGSVRLEIIETSLQKDGEKYSSLVRRLQNPAGENMGPEARAALRGDFRARLFEQVRAAWPRENPEDYYALPPIKALYLMLDWQNRPPFEAVRNLPLTMPKDAPGKSFSDNPLLPPPEYVAGK